MTTKVEPQPLSTKSVVMAPQPIVEIISVTPKMAAQWLLNNLSHQRKVRDKRVTQYAIDMRAGQWLITGESVKFDEHGFLLDGQHRLLACIEADTPFSTLVAFGLSASAYEVLDTGLARSIQDVLRSENIAYSTWLTASMRMVSAYDDGLLDKSAEWMISRQDLIESVRTHHEQLTPIAASAWHLIKRGMTQSAWIAFEYIVTRDGGEQTRAALAIFKAALDSGAGLQEGDPRLALLNWLPQASRKSRFGNRLARHQMSGLVYAWNAFIRGEKRMSIRPKPLGAPFPTIEFLD